MEAIGLIRDNWDAIVAAVGLVGIACESVLLALAALARALRAVAKGLLRLAVTTPTERDDAIILSVILGLEVAATWLEKTAALVPRLRAGAGRDAPKASPPGATLLLPMLMVFGAGLMSGCGGSAEKHARTALDVGARSLVTIDAAGVEVVRAGEARCAEQPSLDAWRECMAPSYRMERSLRTARGVLLAAEASIDASGADGWLSAAPCIARALAELSGAAEAVGLRIPEGAAELLSVARGVGGACEGGI